jgi:hypothetical protein
MNRASRACAFAFALLASQAAPANVSDGAAQELTRKSGLWVQMDSIGQQVRSGMSDAIDKNAGGVAPERKARMLACAEAAFSPETLRGIAVDAVAGALQPSDALPLANWYDSPLGRKITAEEESSARQVIEPQERVRRGAEALAAAGAARRTALQAIVTETHSVDIMADTLIEMAFAVQEGVASLDPAVTPGRIADIHAALASRRPQVLGHYAQISLPAYAFTYARLSDDELQRYADHLDTPPARAFNDGSTRGVARALGAGSAKLGRCLKDAGEKP